MSEVLASPEEVTEYYIKAELGRIVGMHRLDRHSASIVNECLEQFLRELNIKQERSLLLWLSRTYRNNAVHRLANNRDWRLMEVDIGQVVLSRINPPVNAVLAKPEVNWRLGSFIVYLRSYFEQHPHSDPESLEEFRYSSKVYYEKLIAVERGRDVLVIDGAHRAVSLALQGTTTFSAYVTARL